jgi:hypothetical protein
MVDIDKQLSDALTNIRSDKNSKLLTFPPVPDRRKDNPGISDSGMPDLGILDSDIPGRVIDTPVTVRSNFTKVDNDVYDLLAKHQNPSEQAVYRILYRLSWGFHRRLCRIGLARLSQMTGISRSSLCTQVKNLVRKGHIADLGCVTNSGRIYRIYLPQEIGFPSKTEIGNPKDDTNNPGISDSGIPETGSVRNKHTCISETGISDSDTIKENNRFYKESNTLVELFYIKIGQNKISEKKKQTGEDICFGLLNEGFSPEDITYAIDWIKDNVSEVYSFGIVPQIIGQALSCKIQNQERLEVEELNERSRLEKQADDEAKKKRRSEAMVSRDKMTEAERNDLTNMAMNSLTDATKAVFKDKPRVLQQVLDSIEIDILAATIDDR